MHVVCKDITHNIQFDYCTYHYCAGSQRGKPLESDIKTNPLKRIEVYSRLWDENGLMLAKCTSCKPCIRVAVTVCVVPRLVKAYKNDFPTRVM